MSDPRYEVIPERGGQRREVATGLVQPWYTHPALDEIAEMDLADKVVLEWGGGASTIWWSSRAKEVWTIEAHNEWVVKIEKDLFERKIDNVRVFEIWPDQPSYLRCPEGCRPDIVVIDGSSRAECLVTALALPRPLVIIFDNWQQDSIFIDEASEKLMEPYREFGRFHIQPDHTAHEGRPWQTAIWRLP